MSKRGVLYCILIKEVCDMFAQTCSIDDSIFTLEYADSVPSLSKAARVGDLQKIKRLLLKGTSPQTPDNRGWTAVHCCVAANQIESLKLILKLKSKSKKFLVNLTTWENVTPLLIALRSSKPSLEVVRILLEAGADPNQYTHTKLSPLHLACFKKGNIEFVKLLVRFGADVNVQEDLSLFTPLHFAICEGCDLEVIKFLINLSDLSLKNIYDRTAFLEACNADFLDAVQVFLEKDKNFANLKSDIPPIMYAGLVGNLQMTRLLLDSGADVNCRCKAVVKCKSESSDLILLDKENFLPVHSSFTNNELFKLLLSLTDYKELQQLEANYYNFSLFVLIYGNEITYETLKQSHLPDDLKTFKSEVLVQYVLCYPDMKEIVAEKLPQTFKYNFSFESDKLFEAFVNRMPSEALCTNFNILHVLAQIGISSAFHSKNIVTHVLESFLIDCKDPKNINLIKLTCDLLSQSVLTLKQYCRNVLRQEIRSTNSDLQALRKIKESNLPDCLKKFMFFESCT